MLKARGIFVPHFSFDFSLSVLLLPHLWLLSAASRFRFPFFFPVCNWPVLRSVPCSWKESGGPSLCPTMLSSTAGGKGTASARAGCGDRQCEPWRCHPVWLGSQTSLRPLAVQEGGRLKSTWNIEECKSVDLGNTWGQSSRLCHFENAVS